MATTSATMKLTEPAVTDKVGDSIPALAANFGIIDALYPVGTIYQSTKNVSPSTFIGGTWTQLTDRFLVAAGTTFAAGTTGGSSKIGLKRCSAEADGYGLTKVDSFVNRIIVCEDSGITDSTIPPYRAVYMWERTA